MTLTASEAESGTIVSLERVSVSFPVYQAGSRSLKKRVLFHGSAGKIGRDANHQVVIEALRDVSFSLAIGDRLALIAGIFEPFQGKVMTRGRISPMFDINLGIDPDLSGL